MGGEEAGAVLQPAGARHLHVPHEVQQVPLRQVPRSSVLLLPSFSHICPLKVGSTSHDEKRMAFDLSRLVYDPVGQNPVLDYIIRVSSRLNLKNIILAIFASVNYISEI